MTQPVTHFIDRIYSHYLSKDTLLRVIFLKLYHVLSVIFSEASTFPRAAW